MFNVRKIREIATDCEIKMGKKGLLNLTMNCLGRKSKKKDCATNEESPEEKDAKTEASKSGPNVQVRIKSRRIRTSKIDDQFSSENQVQNGQKRTADVGCQCVLEDSETSFVPEAVNDDGFAVKNEMNSGPRCQNQCPSYSVLLRQLYSVPTDPRHLCSNMNS